MGERERVRYFGQRCRICHEPRSNFADLKVESITSSVVSISLKESVRKIQEETRSLTSANQIPSLNFLTFTFTMPVAIKIKHAGKSYDLEVDTSAPATVFKEQIYHLTGVPIDKVKVVVKGGMLKVGTSSHLICRHSSYQS